jgi:hypothetical protein
MTAYTFEVKHKATTGRYYCKVIDGETRQVVYVTKGNHRSAEPAQVEARRALSLAYELRRVIR